MVENLQQKLVSLCKRRGFIYPGSEIYGGLANTYDFGPLGVSMLRNIVDLWWRHFITKRQDMVGLDTSILMSPRVWEASGHVANFNELLIDCKECKYRTAAEKMLEEYFEKEKIEESPDGKTPEEMEALINKHKVPCPECGKFNWTKPRSFNNLFETKIGIVEENKSLCYLRGEIAQGMFVNFKNVLDTSRKKLPFGIAQAGKAFRNEITKGNFIFRTLEFNLAEFEYFFNPQEQPWEEVYAYWKQEMQKWIVSMGLPEDKLVWRLHTDEERAHYSNRTEDLDYEFAIGYKELFGLAYRTDFDLKNHMEQSGVDMRYMDPSTGEKFFPHVVEPTFGVNRIFLALLNEAYVEEENRTVLKLHKDVAPYRVAVFPLLKNKPQLVEKAKEVLEMLVDAGYSVAWDDRGNIGKRYLSQDEIGTPCCVTVDFDTLEDSTVTLRDRDTTDQVRIGIEDLVKALK